MKINENILKILEVILLSGFVLLMGILLLKKREIKRGLNLVENLISEICFLTKNLRLCYDCIILNLGSF